MLKQVKNLIKHPAWAHFCQNCPYLFSHDSHFYSLQIYKEACKLIVRQDNFSIARIYSLMIEQNRFIRHDHLLQKFLFLLLRSFILLIRLLVLTPEYGLVLDVCRVLQCLDAFLASLYCTLLSNNLLVESSYLALDHGKSSFVSVLFPFYYGKVGFELAHLLINKINEARLWIDSDEIKHFLTVFDVKRWQNSLISIEVWEGTFLLGMIKI